MTEVPQSFDRFEVIRVLGKGGMGTVYLARDPRLDRSVALKVLRAEDLTTADRRSRFMPEAKALHRDVAAMSIDTTTGQLFGTLHYLSPEQARGLPADERSDLFSLGIVFYQMATGQLPFNAEAPLLVLERIRDVEPEPFVPVDSSFPPAAAKIIGKLLQKKPEDRYASARDLHTDLDVLSTQTARHTLAPHSRSAIGRTGKRQHRPRVILIVISVLVIGLAIYYAQSGVGNEPPTTAPPSPPPPIRSMAVLPMTNIANRSE